MLGNIGLGFFAVLVPIGLAVGILYSSIYFAIRNGINHSLLGVKLKRDLEAADRAERTGTGESRAS